MTQHDASLVVFQAPFGTDLLCDHIQTVLVTQARQLHFTFGRVDGRHRQAQALLLGKRAGDFALDLENPDLSLAELEIDYELVRTTALAESMHDLYAFAYHGMYRAGDETMNSESSASWISRILFDLSRSSFVDEWEEYAKCHTSIEACLTVCETAQARLVLENLDAGDRFMDWHTTPATDGLSFRQMSLLSGISEPSLRTMANPKRVNALKTRSDKRNAYVEPAEARTWLISKGRYVPLVNADPQGAHMNLTSNSIRSIDELLIRLEQRLHYLLGQDDADGVRQSLQSIDDALLGKRIDGSEYLNLPYDSRLNSEGFLRRIANALQLPADLLNLKYTQLQALATLREVEQRLNQANAKNQLKD